MRIIAIANQKGGCGKTTTAINLASALAGRPPAFAASLAKGGLPAGGRNGRRVLLIDLDPQAHASLGLNVESQDSIYNVISRLTPRKLRLENIIQRIENSFDIVPSNILVGTLEQELADEIGRELKLSEVIAAVKENYDYILIDCAPSLGILTVNALRASDELIIPVETSRFSIQGVEHLLDIVNLVRDRLNHTIQCRVLITMFDSRLRHSFAMLETFRQKFSELLFDTIVHTNVKLKESAVLGQTVAVYDKYSRGAKDYFTLSKEIICAEKKQPAAAETPASPQTAPAPAAASPANGGASVEQKVFPEKMVPAFSEKMETLIRQEVKDVQQLFPVRFSYDAAAAKSVFVTGSFNDWSLDDHCRLTQANGKWEAVLALKPGVYKYQFIVDGVWKEDSRNPNKERNSFGDINSLIEVTANG